MSDPEQDALLDLTPDFSEAVDFSPFPDATLLCELTDITAFRSKQKQTPMVRFTFTIAQDHKYTSTGGEEQNARGRKLFRNCPAAGAGAGFLKSVLREGLGFEPTRFRLPDSKLELLGRKVWITTKLDTTQSPPMNKPDSWRYAPNQ